MWYNDVTKTLDVLAMDEEKTCESCVHFHKHYIKWGKKDFRPIRMGHCGKPRIRFKVVDAPACRWYQEKK